MLAEASARTTALLVDALKETFKSIDLSFLLATLSAVFLLIHGLQGDYLRALEGARQETSAAAAPSGETAEGRDDRGAAQELVVPVLGLKAELFTASILALTLYWVLCFRAAFRVQRMGVIIHRLAKSDRETLAAVLLYPSLATASRGGKIAACLGLCVLGVGVWLLMYAGVEPIGTLLVGAPVMLVPPGYLFWKLLATNVPHEAGRTV